jgi:hypothetical protein
MKLRTASGAGCGGVDGPKNHNECTQLHLGLPGRQHWRDRPEWLNWMSDTHQ